MSPPRRIDTTDTSVTWRIAPFFYLWRLADEPSGNLETASAATVPDILRGVASGASKSNIAASHQTDFASAADRRIVLVDVRIVERWHSSPEL